MNFGGSGSRPRLDERHRALVHAMRPAAIKMTLVPAGFASTYCRSVKRPRQLGPGTHAEPYIQGEFGPKCTSTYRKSNYSSMARSTKVRTRTKTTGTTPSLDRNSSYYTLGSPKSLPAQISHAAHTPTTPPAILSARNAKYSAVHWLNVDVADSTDANACSRDSTKRSLRSS